MQTAEEGVQQTELKSSPNNPFKNPQQQAQPHSIYPQQYHSASIDSGVKGGEDKFESWGNFKSWMIRWRGSRRLVLVIVAIALLLDNMLLTVVGESKIFCFKLFLGEKMQQVKFLSFESFVRVKRRKTDSTVGFPDKRKQFFGWKESFHSKLEVRICVKVSFGFETILMLDF